MKTGWTIKKLGELCGIELGKTPSRSNPSYWDVKHETNNIWLSIADLLNTKNNNVFDSKEYLSSQGAAICKVVKKGTLLLSFKLTLGRVAFAGRELYTNEAIAALSIKNEYELSKNYLYYFLQFFDWKADAERDAKIKGITFNKEKLIEIRVPYPPLSEQQRIVRILDEAFAGIAVARANAEKNLQNAREVFESYLNEVFINGRDWPEKTIGEISQIKGGKRVPKGYKLLTGATNYPYIRVTDFNDSGSINMDDLRYIDKDVHNQIKNYVIYSSDLYLSIAGTIGKTGIIPKELDGAHLTENACRLVFREGIYNRYIYYFTRTKNFIGQAGFNTRTSAQPKLALSRLSTIKLRIPNRNEQEIIVKKFDILANEISRLELVYQRKTIALGALKQSLLNQAFTGQL